MAAPVTTSGPELLLRPVAVRPLYGAVGYAVGTFLPIGVSLAALAALGAVTGESFALAQVFVVLLVLRQVNVFVLSVLYHRGMSHGAVRFHRRFEWFLRLWGWLFLGAGTRTWALVHRWHHATSDTSEDPHSPAKAGESLWTIGKQSIGAFRRAMHTLDHLERFDRGLRWDRLERLIRWDERHGYGVRGVRLPLILAGLVACFVPFHPVWVAALAGVLSLPGLNGSTLVASVWIVNGLGHCAGYRNYELRDASTNVVPFDPFGWGEAYHQNHHARPGCADLAVRRWEWDPGYAVLRGMKRVGLVVELKGR